MSMTSDQLAAALRNERKDAAFKSDPKRYAQWEQDLKEYEEFCAKFGPMED